MEELEAKVRIFEAIANNSRAMCDSYRYMTPSSVASHAVTVYNILNGKE